MTAKASSLGQTLENEVYKPSSHIIYDLGNIAKALKL